MLNFFNEVDIFYGQVNATQVITPMLEISYTSKNLSETLEQTTAQIDDRLRNYVFTNRYNNSFKLQPKHKWLTNC